MKFPATLSLQLTWFVANSGDYVADQVYSKIVGEAPEGFQRNRHLNPNTPFFSSAHGEPRDVMFRCNVLPGRIDFFALPSERSPPNGKLAIIPDGDDVAQRLFSSTQGPDCFSVKDCTRLAAVVKRAAISASLEEANLNLNKLIGSPVHPSSLDLVFQFNLRKASSSGGTVTLNRVLRFAAENFQVFDVTMDLTGSNARGFPRLIQEHAGTTIVADVNTVPQAKPLDGGDVEGLWREIAGEVLGLSAQCTPHDLK